jgi:hypothetical protein
MIVHCKYRLEDLQSVRRPAASNSMKKASTNPGAVHAVKRVADLAPWNFKN